MWAVTLAAAILLAAFSYRVLERPSIALGHRLAARVSARPVTLRLRRPAG
ncbi:hypothetical protein [Candidatus Nephthysia bennettiae]|uniref:Uncharacterized protein n=1 Tax=Candidatus Nephthysia bennettiae TaxID=3127016 RepID=A0A934K4J7_9BACT|nr:hypothetical protein [Candidatus Dormibacteraeota bacterium]MBJ7612762.1 hypothetical protein [Candidatus Dormibacteraeota bacterium]